ncbi:IS110 family transposase [Streptomyces inhibens]|uniref:IS110 family transposase n=1 Tax=Streptomyces inhibens TaxID=2293571 RepID=UPI003CC924ED
MDSEIGAFLGLDVGKGEHHATAVTPAGKKAFDKRLPNSEPKLREVFAKLKAKHGTVLVVVDQPASIGALPLAVARDMGCKVAYLPGLTMRRIADRYPGEAKTDARDAFIIADAARSMPHTLRAVALADEAVAELEMIAGFDDDLAGETTRISNRPRNSRIVDPELPSRRGNKQLKRAFFLSAFAALADPVSRAYYDKKIAQGKHHTQALLCLARRRADVLFAMLRDSTFYDPQPAPMG